jgi:hypothetical protein
MPEGFIAARQTQSTFAPQGALTGLLFALGTLLLIASILATGSVYAYGFYLNKNAAILKEEVTALEDELRPELLAQLLLLDKKMASLKGLLQNHFVASNALKLLEENTLSQVRFNLYSYSSDAKKIDLSGEAAGYTVLAQQVRTFEALPQVERVNFGGLAANEKGQVTFKMGIFFKQPLIRFQGI